MCWGALGPWLPLKGMGPNGTKTLALVVFKADGGGKAMCAGGVGGGRWGLCQKPAES